MKSNSLKKISQIFLITMTAVLALSLGAALKSGLVHSNMNLGNGDLVVQAQQNNDEAGLVEKRATPTPSITKETQYLPASQTQQAQGITFTASNFHTEKNHVFVDVCYDLPGKDVWDINAATLYYGQNQTGNFAVNETSIDIAKDKPQNGFRCLRLDFYDVEPDADLSSLTLVIGNIGQIAPSEGHECEEYLVRINENQKIAEAGIEVVCDQSPSGTQIKLVSSRNNLSEEEVNQIISNAMFNQVNGNWTFMVKENR